MRKLNWLVAFLLFFAVGCFLSTALAEEQKKIAPKRRAGPAKAGEHNERGGAEHREARHDFRGHHDYGHFTADEREMWRGGHWRHARWHGRYGWWWLVGGMWYFFDQPVYPYPQVVPEVAFNAPVLPGAPLVVQPQTQQFWYWCDNPPGYSPYVTSCPSGWRKVPAQMTPTASPPPPPAP